MTFRVALASMAISAVLASQAWADDLKPAVVFDMGGKFDKSFNEGVYNGVEKFKQESGVEYMEFCLLYTSPSPRD